MTIRSTVCSYCNVSFESEDDDGFPTCANATAASSCPWNQRLRFKPQIVGEDFERIEDSPTRLHAAQSLINRGASWHPDIDADGHIAREAESLIARGILKAPRSKRAKEMRATWQLLRDASPALRAAVNYVRGRR